MKGVSQADVLRVITRLNIGGPARQALLLTASLRRTHPTVLAAGTPPPDEGELSRPDVEVVRVPLVRQIDPRRDAAAVHAVRRLLTATHARLVHTHMAKAGTLGRIAAATSRSRPRTVHTFHGHVLEGYFSPPVTRAFLAVERTLARRTDVLIAISEEIRDELLALGIGQPSQYRVVPLGFDLEEHLAVDGPTGELRTRLGIGSHVPLVGVVGRLARIKDHELLLDAFTDVPHAHLAVLGDGEMRAPLEALVRARGLADRVHFTGWWTDIPAAMADMDVVVLSSRNEGTPVSLIEAAACAKPVVATDVGGVRAVVRDARTGLLVRHGDVTGLRGALETLLSDPSRRAVYGQAGRAHVRDRFSQDRLIADIRSLYDDLLN